MLFCNAQPQLQRWKLLTHFVLLRIQSNPSITKSRNNKVFHNPRTRPIGFNAFHISQLWNVTKLWSRDNKIRQTVRPYSAWKSKECTQMHLPPTLIRKIRPQNACMAATLVVDWSSCLCCLPLQYTRGEGKLFAGSHLRRMQTTVLSGLVACCEAGQACYMAGLH